MEKEHFVNRILDYFGYRLVSKMQKRHAPAEFIERYKKDLQWLKENAKDMEIIEGFRYDLGIHPKGHHEIQCEFVAKYLSLSLNEKILDVGSYREFILGLAANRQITTLDIRDRKSVLPNEIVAVGDAKKLDFPDNEFNAVVSLCALEHFGLGRYGGEIDLDADKKAFSEMKRILKPGGLLIFSTDIRKGKPAIVFNAGKIYNQDMIKDFCSGLDLVEEQIINTHDEDDKSGKMLYLGCYKKLN